MHYRLYQYENDYHIGKKSCIHRIVISMGYTANPLAQYVHTLSAAKGANK